MDCEPEKNILVNVIPILAFGGGISTIDISFGGEDSLLIARRQGVDDRQ